MAKFTMKRFSVEGSQADDIPQKPIIERASRIPNGQTKDVQRKQQRLVRIVTKFVIFFWSEAKKNPNSNKEAAKV